jgi:hypothetical protein
MIIQHRKETTGRRLLDWLRALDDALGGDPRADALNTLERRIARLETADSLPASRLDGQG